MVIEATPATDVPLTQADEREPFGSVSSSVVEAATESVLEMPSSRSKDIISSLGAALEPSTSGSADISELAVVPILLVATAEIAAEDISLGPITGPQSPVPILLMHVIEC